MARFHLPRRFWCSCFCNHALTACLVSGMFVQYAMLPPAPTSNKNRHISSSAPSSCPRRAHNLCKFIRSNPANGSSPFVSSFFLLGEAGATAFGAVYTIHSLSDPTTPSLSHVDPYAIPSGHRIKMAHPAPPASLLTARSISARDLPMGLPKQKPHKKSPSATPFCSSSCTNFDS